MCNHEQRLQRTSRIGLTYLANHSTKIVAAVPYARRMVKYPVRRLFHTNPTTNLQPLKEKYEHDVWKPGCHCFTPGSRTSRQALRPAPVGKMGSRCVFRAGVLLAKMIESGELPFRPAPPNTGQKDLARRRRQENDRRRIQPEVETIPHRHSWPNLQYRNRSRPPGTATGGKEAA